MSEYLKMAKAGKVYILGTGSNKINPIHGKDLAEVCVDSAETAQDQTERDVGGPNTYSYEEIGSLACSTLGAKKKIVHIPLGLAKLAVACIRPFSSRGYQAANFFTTVMSNDFVAPTAGSHNLDHYFEQMSKRG